MKVQVKRVFKSYSPKKPKRADRLCMKFSSTFNTSVQGCLYSLFQNRRRPHFLLLHLFRRFLLTPSRSLSGKQENLSSNASRHISNSLSVYLFFDFELNNGGMKVQVKRAFKSYFFVAKKNNKGITGIVSPEYFLSISQTCISHHGCRKVSNSGC